MSILKTKPNFYMLVGAPGSGKTTYANNNYKELNAIILSSDEIRKELLGSEDNQSNNAIVFSTMHKRMKELLSTGQNVIFDATNINKKTRALTLKELKNLNVNKFAIVLKTPLNVCYENNKKRNRVVKKNIIDKFQKLFEMPTKDEGFDEIIVINQFD